jgi:hypothetical protein
MRDGRIQRSYARKRCEFGARPRIEAYLVDLGMHAIDQLAKLDADISVADCSGG